MKLNKKELSSNSWESADIILPKFDLDAVTKKTFASPAWIHFGAGNIFRAFPAAVQQNLLNNGLTDTGIIVAEGYDYEIIDKLFDPCDNLTLLVTLKSDGTIEKTVIGSITEALRVDRDNTADFARLQEIFRKPSLQTVSFTITEKGYSLGAPGVAEDLENDPSKSKSYIGKLAALVYERYLAGQLPIALVSMDNCSHNGDKLRDAVCAFGQSWSEKGLCEKGFIEYLQNPKLVSFPWSMIDKITPRPDDAVKEMLSADGFEDTEGTVTEKNTFIAPFVNAEETEWLVIEDDFPNGRPPLEKGGVIFTDRETVDKVEKMKVCTCLNPLHTALAIFGCLLGYEKISDEMKDKDLVNLISKVGYVEGLPVVVNPEILNPKEFIDNVVEVRLPNPFMPDTPQRIACDTSQKLPIRFGETIKAYVASPDLNVTDLKAIPLVLAGWLRYLLAIDDNGNAFELSPDPALSRLQPLFNGFKLGDGEKFRDALVAILSNPIYFGVDLYEVGLGKDIETAFIQMSGKVGAVRDALKGLTESKEV